MMIMISLPPPPEARLGPEPPAPAPLFPPTLARSGVEGLAEAAETAALPRDAALLELPDSLQENGKEKTP